MLEPQLQWAWTGVDQLEDEQLPVPYTNAWMPAGSR
jgi:hypothetical protein